MEDAKSLSERVYNTLTEEIVRGEYHAHDIINEGTLAEKFGCSKAPVRDALSVLCTEGILRNLPRFGYEVVAFSPTDVRDILKVRELLECGLLQSAYEKLSPKKLEILWDLAKQGEEEKAMWLHWNANTAFHLKLMSFTENSYAYHQLAQILNRLKFAYGQYYWDKWTENFSDDKHHYHRHVMEALEAKDPDSAVRYLMLDIREFY